MTAFRSAKVLWLLEILDEDDDGAVFGVREVVGVPETEFFFSADVLE